MGIAFPGDLREKVVLTWKATPLQATVGGNPACRALGAGSRGEPGAGFWLLPEDWSGPKKRPGLSSLDYI